MFSSQIRRVVIEKSDGNLMEMALVSGGGGGGNVNKNTTKTQLCEYTQ